MEAFRPRPDADVVLVLGAEGLIGTELRRRLISDFRLISVDVRPPEPIRTRVGDAECRAERLVQADLGDPDQIDDIWQRVPEEAFAHIAAVVHMAAYYDFRNAPDPRYERLNRALEHLLDRIEATVPEEAPLIYASSMSALAPTEPGEPQTEESPRRGAWRYPASKIEAEDILREANLERPTVELVLAAVYSDLCQLVPLFQTIELVAGCSPAKFVYPGPIDRGLTYVHLDGAARAFERAASRLYGESGHHRYLVGQPEPMNYAEIHRRASRAFYGEERALWSVPRLLAYVGTACRYAFLRLLGRRPFFQPWMIETAGDHFEFDLSHTRSQLGWEPRRSIHRDLGRILELAVHHRDVWMEVNRSRPW